jgi:putative transposase
VQVLPSTLRQLGITHRRTAYNHPEGNGRIERFHRSLKEEEVWLHEYQSFAEARDSIARWIHQYNHQRPHQALHYRTPAAVRQTFHQPQPLTKIEALCV